MKKYITAAIVIVLALVVGIYIGAKLFSTTRILAGASTPGTTFGSPKQSLVVWNLLSSTGTTTSILNSDSQDRVIESAKFACTGIGTSFTAYTGGGLTSNGVQITAATTSAPVTGVIPTTNLVLDSSDTLATTTGFAYLGSSTPGTTQATITNRIWASGSYLTFQTNATNTATCSIGVSYLPE